mmetsp:Transcript_78774/g.222719  ORF Transcript_78774/g.222719 Transcript_78774/m.222719 type:complete len:145 (-) Transcript_78774:224-658(-)
MRSWAPALFRIRGHHGYNTKPSLVLTILLSNSKTRQHNRMEVALLLATLTAVLLLVELVAVEWRAEQGMLCSRADSTSPSLPASILPSNWQTRRCNCAVGRGLLQAGPRAAVSQVVPSVGMLQALAPAGLLGTLCLHACNTNLS